jgi:calcineurin-like phosphoesterase
MTGPYNSVIGVEKEPVVRKFLTAAPVRMEVARGQVELRGVIVDADPQTGKASAIRPCMRSHAMG